LYFHGKFALWSQWAKVRNKGDPIAVNHNFPGMFEVDRHPGADHRLHLTQAPNRLIRVAHQHARFQKCRHSRPFHPVIAMLDKPDLAALIASRICHDLISPIGAIGNGVELLAMDAGAQRPEMALISESVANANARIRFFRISFGAASGDQRIARSEVMSVLTDLTRGGRVSYAWTSVADLPRREVRLAFLLLQCVETALAYGGKVVVTREEMGWTILAEATRLRIEPALWEVLTEPRAPSDIGAGQVHFALVPEELARQGRRLVTEIGETTIRLTF
jgi:histidine phosphotransferase ChpT